MTEYEKIIKALSSCQHIASNCIDCPYNEYFNTSHDCEIKLHNDASTMLEYMLKDMTDMHKERDGCIVCKGQADSETQNWCENNDYDCVKCTATECRCFGCRDENKWEWRGN